MTAQLAIYGVRQDGHITRVARHLVALGGDVVLIDPEFGRTCSLEFSNAGRRSAIQGIDPATGERRSLGRDYAYWLRNKKRYTHFADKAEQQAQFTISEMTATIVGDMKANGVRTYNDYASVKYHESKPLQLRVAAECGLTIPETLISNNHSDMVAFAERLGHAHLAMKAVENVFIAPPMSDPTDSVLLYTSLVSLDELRQADPETFAGPPFILQAYIDKAYEVRLIMFDGEALAYRIDSQATEAGKIDWRLADDTPGELMAVPDGVHRLCHAYLTASNLNYGAFDFCVDKADQWTFLECNAEGQWAWLEGAEQEISRLFARQFHRLLSA